MKIRNRITLWVSLAGVISTTVLSLIVFLWGLETPYEFLDQELEIRAHTMVEELARAPKQGIGVEKESLEHFSHLYWVRIYDAGQQLLFSSQMAEEIPLPMKAGVHGYLVNTDIPIKRFYAEESDEAAGFWNRIFTITVQGTTYMVHVARPVESIVGESIESAVMIGTALLATALILIAVSYQVAGKILHPVQEINRLAAAINANTLENRIPVAGNGDEIDALAVTLNQMFNRLQYSFLRQKEFVANASHELKTPITLLRLSMEETLQDESLPVNLQEKLLAQERSLARISQLVKSLLDLSRLELIELPEKETFCLNTLIADVAENFQVLMQDQRLTFQGELQGCLSLHADQEMIRRVLINLLDNAIRYNLPGGQVFCRTSGEAGTVTLTIANTGPGIGKQDQARIFDQFYRCEQSRSTVHGGSGLGLTIVKRIVELHGGTIAVESEPQAWTKFKVVFPA
jgi:signal transduction histidine kinase